MNSRERILNAFKCKITDKIPVSLNTLTSGLIRAEESLVCDLIYSTDPNIWVYLDTDFLGYEIVFGKKLYEYSKIQKVKNETKITISTPKGNLTQITEHRTDSDWVTEHFFKSFEDLDKFYSFDYIPFKAKDINLSEYFYWNKIIRNEGIVSVVIPDAAVILYTLLGPTKFYLNLLDNYDAVKKFTEIMEKRIETYVSKLFHVINDPPIVFLISGPEIFTRPMTSNFYYNKLILPYDNKLIKLIQQNGGIANIHQHGMVKESLQSLLKMRPNAVSPFEAPPAGDMTVKRAKERLVKKICVIGNLDDLQVLSKKDKKIIRLEALKLIRDAALDGGFILGGTDSSVLTDEMLKSFILMGKICEVYGHYPINFKVIYEKIRFLEI